MIAVTSMNHGGAGAVHIKKKYGRIMAKVNMAHHTVAFSSVIVVDIFAADYLGPDIGNCVCSHIH